MPDQGRNTYLDDVLANQERLESDLRSKAYAATNAGSGAGSAAGAPRPQIPSPEQIRGVADAGLPALSMPAPPAPAGSVAPAAQSRGRAARLERFAAEVDAGRGGGGGGGGGSAAAANGVEVRITGVGRWKTVLVPPNAFVVHTRRGETKPRHIGLGVSFRYRPATDSFLVVPGAMQTILMNAFCICSELQGILVQAYVQWIIEDFGTAYRRLDFSDPEDPMRLVNLQLREQAEAAIKDKVATMSVHEVLSDRQPIIEELTARLRAVAEGSGEAEAGLGLRIVTVQIKEAVVSSKTLWENLQKPFRSEQGRLAALAELAADSVITDSRMAESRKQETRRLSDERELSELRALNGAREFDRDAAEQSRRDEQSQSNARKAADEAHRTRLQTLALERERHEQESVMARLRLEEEQELARLRLEAELAAVRARHAAEHDRQVLELERERVRAEIANARTAAALQAELIERLPEIVEKLPVPSDYKAVTVGGADGGSLAGVVAQVSAVLGALKAGE
ncbi:SPFH domain-containing protein [Catenulispora rubra]|uniref:SPFH domain-containing protein n=1 Tax=Catenulispora rubra TaxID=280293 RepID=UPI001892564B|nr:SPFH domain-containing protein [Catenulispora rubra]